MTNENDISVARIVDNAVINKPLVQCSAVHQHDLTVSLNFSRSLRVLWIISAELQILFT